MSHRTTPLASSRINGDARISIEVVKPALGAPFIRIVWPPQPATVVTPGEFPDVASTIATLFARAHVVLAALKAGREL